MSGNPPSDYTVSPSLKPYTSHPAAFLAANPAVDNLIAGALVTDPRGRVLLLRRAPTDSWPLKWEVPGGGVDPSDASLVAAAVRELWEESGLTACHVRAPVGLLLPDDSPSPSPSPSSSADGGEDGEVLVEVKGHLVLFRETGETWGKLTAWIDVQSCDAVVVRDDEHAEWAWVTEEEATRRRFEDGRELDFVSEGVRMTVLEGFRLWKTNQQE